MNQGFTNLRSLAALLATLCACATNTSNPATASLFLSSDVTTLATDGTTANITATAIDASGNKGTGTVTFTVSYGDLNATGTVTATGTLGSDGTTKVTYACNKSVEPKCVNGTITINASWTTATAGVHLTLGTVTTGGGNPDAGGGNPDAGGGNPDGGTASPVASKISLASLFPAYVIVSGAAGAGLPGTSTATFSVLDQNNKPMTGATVTVTEQLGESLVTIGAAGTTDASGLASVTLTGGATAGLAHLSATVGALDPLPFSLKVIGAPSIIIETSATPSVLGLKGSGIQEAGLMTFLVTDSQNTPVPGVTVNFTQGNPALLALANATTVTDANGIATVAFSSASKNNAGVAEVIATVPATGAVTHAHIGVRGAKPSASGFNFTCEKANLPKYTTTTEYFTMNCTVRLSDRYGNRVGVPTPVFFASEAGSITATALTKAFDPAAGASDPDEGSATVVFSTDTGNGFRPQETTAMAALATQAYGARPAEPTNGSKNPRDQVVTIIAMVRGEEAFVDANKNDQFDAASEVFFDEGDPFIDANDNNAYDSASEVRFCGLNPDCSAYHAPNGTWDADTLLWAPTWVAFTDFAIPKADPYLPGSCLDYSDNDASNPFSAVTQVAMLDQFLNEPAAGTTYAAQVEGNPTGITVVTLEAPNQLDTLGALGGRGGGYDWVPVWESDNTKKCIPGNYPPTGACIFEFEVFGWSSGYNLAVQVVNGNGTPATVAAPPGHACGGSPTVGSHLGAFSVAFNATENGVISTGTRSGTFGF